MHGLVPPEPHGIWDHDFLEVFLTKIFFNDMMSQKLWAAAVGSFDVHIWYNRVVHNNGSML